MAKPDYKPATAPAAISTPASQSTLLDDEAAPQIPAVAANAAPAEATEPDAILVAMERDTPAHDGGPTTADVHPNEVNAMYGYGWRLAGK